VGVAAALRCQVRNDPRKSNLAVLYFLWAFLGDENLASSLPSPKPGLVSGTQEKRPMRSLNAGASTAFILVCTESTPSNSFN
jgi:hypothetical protein